jgi:HTTM domain
MLRRLGAFLDAPLPVASLGFFRVAMAAFVLVQGALWYRDWLLFFGSDGWLQWEISASLNVGWTLHLSHIHAVLQRVGFTPDQTAMAFFWVYMASAVGVLLGYRTRIWTILACLCHYVIMNTISTFVYGVDVFLQIALFYLAVMPVEKAWSLDARFKRVSVEPTWVTTLSIRVLQFHMCLIYMSAGFEKMRSAAWWDGNVLWRSLVQPDFRQFDLLWLAQHPWLPASLAWFTIVVESGYFIALWVPRLRVIWLAAVIGLHLGIGLFLGLWLFGIIMILLSLSAFGYAALGDVKAYLSARRAPAPPVPAVISQPATAD